MASKSALPVLQFLANKKRTSIKFSPCITNNKGETAIYILADRSTKDFAKRADIYLNTFGIDINRRTNQGNSPLSAAIKNARYANDWTEPITWLLEHNAEVSEHEVLSCLEQSLKRLEILQLLQKHSGILHTLNQLEKDAVWIAACSQRKRSNNVPKYLRQNQITHSNAISIENAATSFLSIPSELWLEIAQMLEIPCLAALEATCRTLRGIFCYSKVWEISYWHHFDTFPIKHLKRSAIKHMNWKAIWQAQDRSYVTKHHFSRRCVWFEIPFWCRSQKEQKSNLRILFKLMFGEKAALPLPLALSTPEFRRLHNLYSQKILKRASGPLKVDKMRAFRDRWGHTCVFDFSSHKGYADYSS